MVCFLLVGILFECVSAAAIETMGADLTFWQANGLDELLYGVKLERCETKILTDGLHHALILRRVGSGIFLKILVCVTLKLFNYSACYQLHVAL